MSASSYDGPYGASFICVNNCLKAWNQGLDRGKAENLEVYEATKLAAKFFRKAMPVLIGEDNIRGFIAAVTKGVLMDVFYPKEASALIYMAQVALSSLPREVRQVGRPKKEPEAQPASAEGPIPAPATAAPPADTEAPTAQEPAQPAVEPPAPQPGEIPTIQACVANLRTTRNRSVPHPARRLHRARGGRSSHVVKKINTPLPSPQPLTPAKRQASSANPARFLRRSLHPMLHRKLIPPLPRFAGDASNDIGTANNGRGWKLTAREDSICGSRVRNDSISVHFFHTAKLPSSPTNTKSPK